MPGPAPGAPRGQDSRWDPRCAQAHAHQPQPTAATDAGSRCRTEPRPQGACPCVLARGALGRPRRPCRRVERCRAGAPGKLLGQVLALGSLPDSPSCKPASVQRAPAISELQTRHPRTQLPPSRAWEGRAQSPCPAPGERPRPSALPVPGV